MRIAHSTKYLPRSEWAAALRLRALKGFSEPNLDACLQAFRRHSAFYAERLAGVSSWSDIPILTKTELAELPVITDEPVHEVRTSGTTGFQITVRNTMSERQFRQALAYRPFLFYPLGNLTKEEVRQVIFVDGTEVDLVDKQQWPFNFGEHKWLTWKVGIAASAEQILSLLKLVRPQVIRGLSSGIVRFAEQVNAPLDQLGVQVVSSSGEHLPSSWRTTMRDAFGARVLDRYGSTETGSMAWQCPYCNDYHANSDEIILESGPEGLLATPLFIESQPMLRYQLGDQVELHNEVHDCRIRLPKLSVLEARRDDWLIDGAGRKVSPLSFQFEQIDGLTAWRVHQQQNGELRFYFDADASATNIQAQLTAHIRHIVPDRDCVLVPGMWKLERAGKFKRVTSDFIPALNQ
jgi:phenylacetate-coenzyme A ligase PaaK-like adenylate-forming protein